MAQKINLKTRTNVGTATFRCRRLTTQRPHCSVELKACI